MRKFSITVPFIYQSNIILVSKNFDIPERFLSILSEKADAEDTEMQINSLVNKKDFD